MMMTEEEIGQGLLEMLNSDHIKFLELKAKGLCELFEIIDGQVKQIRLFKETYNRYTPERPTIKDAQELAAEHNGKCLSETYTNVRTNMTWECSEKHQWSANYNSIQQGSWCPQCYRQKKNKEKEKMNKTKEDDQVIHLYKKDVLYDEAKIPLETLCGSKKDMRLPSGVWLVTCLPCLAAIQKIEDEGTKHKVPELKSRTKEK